MPRRIQVRRSPIHGNGVFALIDIPRGTRIIEYKGARITHATVLRQHPADPENPFHTFLFALSNGRYCIDAGNGDNAARWINHRCAPNCEAVEEHDRQGVVRVYLYAKRGIRTGEELSFDYRLQLDHAATDEHRRNYLCRCRSWNCRRTMLAPIAPGSPFILHGSSR
ncbi:SET domain-containing protein [Paraburkholderia sp.]|uniref:SET domain-containing protein n=1 Tax=Paraburkholderia sp. TaxID=1926495 RepID=UPI0039E5FD05